MEEGRAGMGRRALLGLVGGSAAAAVAAPLALADTAPSPQRDSAVSGQRVDLIVRSRTIEVNGKAATVLGITGFARLARSRGTGSTGPFLFPREPHAPTD